MKRFYSILVAAAVMLCLSACKSTPDGACVIEGKVTVPEYKTLCLVEFDGTELDNTIRRSDGSFKFVCTDPLMPRVVVLEFRNPDVPSDILYLPVALEPGKVKVALGEYIGLSGTPLNDEIKKFFDDMQVLADSFAEVSTVDAMKKAYSAFYLKKILENDDNAFGLYLKFAYASELTHEDLQTLMAE